MRRRLALAASAVAVALGTAAGTLPGTATAAPAAPAVVLVNLPAQRICTGSTFTVGVWYQRASGGSRAYRISVTGPLGVRFFYRHGQAPASGWLLWRVRAGRSGQYRTVYSTRRPGSTVWTRLPFITQARRCAAAHVSVEARLQ